MERENNVFENNVCFPIINVSAYNNIKGHKYFTCMLKENALKKYNGMRTTQY